MLEVLFQENFVSVVASDPPHFPFPSREGSLRRSGLVNVRISSSRNANSPFWSYFCRSFRLRADTCRLVHSRRRERRICREQAWASIPPLLRETELTGSSANSDKVFSAAWLNHNTFLLGSKDNKLLLCDSMLGRQFDVPLPKRPHPRQRSQASPRGIYSMAMNASHTLLATGADDPNDAAVFSIPSFQPVSLLQKHDDLIFAATWITDTILVTGSRDTTLKMWSISNSGHSFLRSENPIADRSYHLDKVRDLKYCMLLEKLVSLSQDGTCKVWDPHLMDVVSSFALILSQILAYNLFLLPYHMFMLDWPSWKSQIGTVPLHHKKELVCLGLMSPVVAIGSQKWITLIDLRCGHIITEVESADEGWESCSEDEGSGRELYYHDTGESFLDANNAFFNQFQGLRKKNAVHTHAYDISGTSLLAAGGPLLYGVRGCYVAIWY